MTTLPDDNWFWGKRNMLALFAGSGVFVLLYAVEMLRGVDSVSTLVFASIPFLSAMIVAMLVPSRKLIYKSCFLGLLLNIILSPFMFAEGLVCVIFAAPIFAAFTAAAAALVYFARGDDRTLRDRMKKPPGQLMLLVILALGAGTIWDEMILSRGAPIETVRTVVEISSPRAEVWKRMTFDRAPIAKVPLWLRLWIAQPKNYAFGATGIGARRETDFGSPRYGDDKDAIRNKLVYEIVDWRPNEGCVFECRENHSRMRQWINLLDSRVELSDSDAGKTTVVFTTRYRRRLGPSPYFTPFLSAAVRGMNEMLAEEIGAVTP